jgi:hypothetical protein
MEALNAKAKASSLHATPAQQRILPPSKVQTDAHTVTMAYLEERKAKWAVATQVATVGTDLVEIGNNAGCAIM